MLVKSVRGNFDLLDSIGEGGLTRLWLERCLLVVDFGFMGWHAIVPVT